ncbi:MAG TPA: NAD(P) transhydrogenase subunit alpha [Spirochaetia bacterium]|jgi:NAD(P) transhydrogenase subunit alpha|nr:NAD(P) transhydrogenase subunit alpha [Spirochaetia bacterium]
MSIIALVVLFIISSLIGYRVIRSVPSLLHTPLMSGTNALSGITILGALSATACAVRAGSSFFAAVLGAFAVVLATINVVAGFLVTDRMLRMFTKKDRKAQQGE